MCGENQERDADFLDYQCGPVVSKNCGSCQKKVQRNFEKPSFEEKIRFLAHILDLSEQINCIVMQAGHVSFQCLIVKDV